MNTKRRTPHQIQILLTLVLVGVSVLPTDVTDAQGLTGTLIGTVRDEQGAVVPGGHIRVISPALIGGP